MNDLILIADYNERKKIADKYGYELIDHKLELYGIKKKS